ncbi:E3 SUMO-protein ligase ZBED1-like [Epinephelus fuscoguttatus]|uniref:E3 SUMO-protein ligase ZBED1-like n=1 Tax=Epinephelus fuscoguttatus TaxID=293821 RepID=UPI0020D13105|nr:E3 SUMO-protein ligase ZBED1-like [Epinephelus fuscoguttatus]
MIDRILEQQKALAEVLSDDRNTWHLILGNQDLDLLESVSKALGPLLEFTDALSGEDYVSVSHLKPVLSLFNTTLLTPKEDDTDLTKSLKKKMLEYMNSKYEDRDMQELLDVASFLDPRYKTQYISENSVPINKARLVSEMMTMELKNAPECIREEVPPPPTKKTKKSLASFFKSSTASATAPVDPTAAIDAELNSYCLPHLTMKRTPFCGGKPTKSTFPGSATWQENICACRQPSRSQRDSSVQGAIL